MTSTARTVVVPVDNPPKPPDLLLHVLNDYDLGRNFPGTSTRRCCMSGTWVIGVVSLKRWRKRNPRLWNCGSRCIE